MTHFRTDRSVIICALLSCLGILLGYVETLLIPDLLFPGIKLGISNAVVLYSVITLRKRDAFCVGLIKSVVNGLLFSGITSCFYSVTGTIFSVLAMTALKKVYINSKITSIGISVVGSAVFNIGQLLAAILILKTIAPLYYLSYYLLLSALTGAVTGAVVQIIINKGVVK
ncbi:MAG: Gx transporter family protein [Clostridia bacterium]|nr:Gx transporter family protein [Clostridia bacterium]